MCVEQKVLSPVLSWILAVLQPWLSQDRKSTARVAPSVSVLFPKSHPLFFPSLPRNFTTTSCAVSGHLWTCFPPSQEMPSSHGRGNSNAGPGLGKPGPNPPSYKLNMRFWVEAGRRNARLSAVTLVTAELCGWEPAQGVRWGEDEVGHGSRFLQRAQIESWRCL